MKKAQLLFVDLHKPRNRLCALKMEATNLKLAEILRIVRMFGEFTRQLALTKLMDCPIVVGPSHPESRGECVLQV